MTKCLAGLSVLAGATFALAQREVIQVESVLDRLEKRLMDQEGEALTFGERELSSGPAAKEAGTKYKLPKTTIQGDTEDMSKMRDLAAAINQLEGQVDQLSSDVQRTKQKILEDARVDNFISIEARLNETDLAAIRSMRVRLDGYDVYSVSEEAGLWLPAKQVPLYAGPLQPGSHKIDLEVRLVLKQKESLPVNADVYRTVNQSFDLKIPDGQVKTRYVVNLEPPKDHGTSAQATLETIK